jgi:hypothetical protein
MSPLRNLLAFVAALIIYSIFVGAIFHTDKEVKTKSKMFTIYKWLSLCGYALFAVGLVFIIASFFA